jgi:hypothetical protein
LRGIWSTLVGGRMPGVEAPVHRAVLDLGTYETKALVVRSDSRENLIIGAGSAQHGPNSVSQFGGSVDLPTMVRSCDRALRQAEDMTQGCCESQVVPDWVVFCVPHHWTVAQSHTVTHRRRSPSSRVTERELLEVVRRAQRLALRQLGEDVGSRIADHWTKLELLESSVTAVRIDGHGVTSPVGLQGERLAVTVFNVVVPAAYLRGVESVIEGLGLEILKVTSCWQAVAAAASEKRGICVDLGGHTTGVMLVHGNSALTTASLPIGGRDFTTQLATAFELTDEDAERLKLAYSRGRLDPRVASRVGAVLGQLVERWMGELEGALGTLCGVEGLPGKFSLCGGGSILPGVAEALRSYPWERRLKCKQHPEVQLIRPEEIRDVLDGTGQLRGQQYACPMAIAGHFGARGAKMASWESVLWEVKRPNTFVDGGERS